MELASDSDRPRILGFLVGGDLLPVEQLTVLYGLNGAGKTRTLRSIEEFFAGVDPRSRWRASALVQLSADGPQAGWSTELDNWGDGLDSLSDDDLLAWVASCLPDEGDGELPAKWEDPKRRQGLLREWQTQRLVVLEARGTDRRAEWMARPVVVTGADTPHATRAVEIFDELEAEDPDSDEREYAWTDALVQLGVYVEARLPHFGTVAGFMTGANFPEEREPIRELPWARFPELPDIGIRLQAAVSGDVHDETRNILMDHLYGEDLHVVRGGGVELSERLNALRDRLVAGANATYTGILQDAPRLTLEIAVAGLPKRSVEWRVESDGPVEWDGSVRTLELSEVSAAQERWARWSIMQALDELPLAPIFDRPRGPEPARLSVIDEPEAALHRSAEAQMAEYVAAATSPTRRFLIATHSPELLDSPEADVVEVKRSGRHTRLAPLATVDRAAMKDLGLTPSDLLRRQRAFVLVEGQHDADVLDILLGDELRRLRVDVIPLRGATELSATKSRFLFEYTDAHVVVMLDNIKSEQVSQAWERIRAARLADGVDAARKVLAGEFPKGLWGKKVEVKALGEFLSASLDNDQWDRVTPFGLTLGDIIEYLPVRELVPGKLTWGQLRATFEDEMQSGTAKAKSFKPWLASRGAQVTDQKVRDAAVAMDHIPQDFERLRKTLEAVTQR